MNKQLSLSVLEDELSQVRTKKKEFLAQIERIVPWGEWIKLIKPCYFKGTEINFQNNYLFKAKVFLKSTIFHREKSTFRRFMLQAKAQNA